MVSIAHNLKYWLFLQPRILYFMVLENVLQKLKHYCSYSERCHADVINKLYELEVWKKDQDEIIATLIQENYLNEERYTCSFVRGHFYIKKWGKNKILAALKQKNISNYCIKKGMLEIDEDDYNLLFEKLLNDKWQSLGAEKNKFIKMTKTKNYLIQRGFEYNLIYSFFQKL